VTAVLDGLTVDRELEARGIDWTREEYELVCVVRCAGFVGALAFVNAVGALAEIADHHPDIDIRYNVVSLRLTTHSAGGLTEKDLSLAASVDEMKGPPVR
jgi:4a-hydroxytetrahydrobiopterin dehydratase